MECEPTISPLVLASHAVVFRGLVLPPPHKRLLTQTPHSFPFVLLLKHLSQSLSRPCPMISKQIAVYCGRFRFPRAGEYFVSSYEVLRETNSIRESKTECRRYYGEIYSI